jgi:hypothetical protein
VQDPLAELILSGEVLDGQKVDIGAGPRGLTFNGETVEGFDSEFESRGGPAAPVVHREGPRTTH